ncbi:hypothetical protein L1987_30738 [Smallanthus sonchifolius]|uniref:Uncharacterized protein n=1 Tax=Smallanthus sonchifolius TaxID=185202 RepID=A0ACB9I317_9ASTR|nr:hypothetical protein L1987_30738 [Smallanthus sonchifolius]
MEAWWGVVGGGEVGQALLHFKHGVIDETNRLDSWVTGTDCCGWAGIACDNSTGQVIRNLSKLHMLCLGKFSNENYPPLESTSMTSMKWVASLAMLQHLDMSGVDLSKAVDWLPVINTLPSLVQLHLSGCNLANIHPYVPSLNLTSLSLLDLSYNDFHSSVPKWIFSIISLVSLDLSGCDFHGPVPSSIYSFRNLTSLKLLHVNRNAFMNSSFVLKELSSSNLISLDISVCGVSNIGS